MDAALTSLVGILWRERSQCERLVYALVSEQLLLAAGHGRWLNYADDDVQKVSAELRDIEVLRAAEAESLTATIDLQSGAPLAQLARATPEPWREILDAHRAALRTLVVEIDTVVTENDRLLRAGAPSDHEHDWATNGTDPAATHHPYPPRCVRSSREASKLGAATAVDTPATGTRPAGPAYIHPSETTIDTSALHATYEAARQTLVNIRPISLTDFLQ